MTSTNRPRTVARRLLGIGALAVMATACPVEPAPVDHTQQVNACKTEGATIRTAYQAAHAGQQVNPTETVHDYLGSGFAPVYFDLEVGPTTHPVGRSSSTWSTVSEAECASLTLAQVPLGYS